MSLVVVVEGDTDVPVAKALAADAGLEVGHVYDMAGKSQLDAKLDGFNSAARGSPWLVLRDLDQDAVCAPELVGQRLLRPSTWMIFRIAVREVEAWLLADARGLSKFLHVPERLFPADPDAEGDPTATLVNLARRSGHSKIRTAMVPPPGANAQVGQLYEATIIEFASRHWNLERACQRSDSLKRARTALRELGSRWRAHTAGP